MVNTVVVGAGMGGLSAAIRLAAAGRQVVVLEQYAEPGGKVGQSAVGEMAFDTGPSLLTLPEVFDRVLRLAGTSLAEEVALRCLSPSFRYIYPDGAVLDTYAELDATLESVGRALGARAQTELAAFLTYARRIWEASADNFVFCEAPSLSGITKLGPRAWLSLPRIDAHRTMISAIRQRIKSPHLRSLLLRFATYNGSDPRRAPATLNCIAHVDLALGGHGVEGGLHALAQAFFRVAQRLGVTFRFCSPVERIIAGSGANRFEVVSNGDRFSADQVVVNADVAHLAETLLIAPGEKPKVSTPFSTSGICAVFRAESRAERAAHTVIFPECYEDEFSDLFDAQRIPRQPTVYLCDQARAHGRIEVEGAVPVFAMINAPSVTREQENEASLELPSALARLRERAVSVGALGIKDDMVWHRGHVDLARRYPGSRGAIYGAASNDALSAFRRPPNRVPNMPGLYLASGSAHPGGGVPMCVQSGLLAAECALADAEGFKRFR